MRSSCLQDHHSLLLQKRTILMNMINFRRIGRNGVSKRRFGPCLCHSELEALLPSSDSSGRIRFRRLLRITATTSPPIEKIPRRGSGSLREDLQHGRRIPRAVAILEHHYLASRSTVLMKLRKHHTTLDLSYNQGFSAKTYLQQGRRFAPTLKLCQHSELRNILVGAIESCTQLCERSLFYETLKSSQ